MNKIIILKAITYLLILTLVSGFAEAKSAEDVRIVITPDSQDVVDSVKKAVENNGGRFVRETLDNKLIFVIPSATLNNQISVQSIPGAGNIEEDLQIQLPETNIEFADNAGTNVQFTPNDPYYASQWGIRMIGANKAWEVETGENMIIAVIDTGVDYTHEDLAAVKENLGYDFVNNDADAMDDNGHGTHVAGIIAATTNNGIGVAGVAPHAIIIPIKVCNYAGSCYYSDIADGVRYAANNGAKILSLSLGGLSPDRLTYDATRYAVLQKGTLVIAAAGNRGTEQPEYPAAYPWCMAIGALDSNGNKASYSQYGNFLTLMAPGSSIISTYPGNRYAYMSGTSMATPHASGVAALYWSHNLSRTNKQVAIDMIKYADDLGTPGWDKYYGYGRVDAYPVDG